MNWRSIDPKKEQGKLAAIVIAGATIGGMFGGDLARFAYQLLGWPYPGN